MFGRLGPWAWALEVQEPSPIIASVARPRTFHPPALLGSVRFSRTVVTLDGCSTPRYSG
jgi:hypothetical protein